MSTFSSWHQVSAPELNQLGVDTYTFKAGYQNLSSATRNREFRLLNLMNTPEHYSAPFHSVSSKVAKSTKMAAAHIQTYVLHVTWSILYTYLITPCVSSFYFSFSSSCFRHCRTWTSPPFPPESTATPFLSDDLASMPSL